MEEWGRWEGQNFQPLKEEEEEKKEEEKEENEEEEVEEEEEKEDEEKKRWRGRRRRQRRPQGRPKYRWEDNIKQDICQMKIKNWTACVQDREKWKKEVVEKDKTFSN